MPYSAATARFWLRKGGVTQRLCSTPFRGRSHTYPHSALLRTLSRPLLRGGPLLGDRQTAALPAWTFCGAQRLGNAASSGGLLPGKKGVDTSLEQCVGRLSHDRTTVRHLQSPIFAPEGCSGTPRQPTLRLQRQLLCDYHQHLLIGEFDQAGTGDTRWVHSRPVRGRKHRRTTPTVR